MKPFLPAILLLLLLPPPAAGGSPPPGQAPLPGGKCVACHTPHPLPPGGGEADGARRGDRDPGKGCVGCHRGDPRTGRKELAHRGFLPPIVARFRLPGDAATERGRRLLARSGCRRCHVSGGTGVSLAANLDDSVATLSPGDLSLAVREPAAAMPDFRFGEEDRAALVNALLANGEGREGETDAPRVVHFSKGAGRKGEEHPFAVRCGPCHRALTERFGLLGSGNAGPDLSSLFTPFHPGRGRGGTPWREEAIPGWTRNPRSVRPLALMPPLRLKEGEAEEAATALRVDAARLRLPPPPAPRRAAGK